MHDFNSDAELGSALRRAVISVFLLSSILLVILAIHFLVKDHQKTTALATLAASGLFAFMVVAICRPGLLDLLARPVFRGNGVGVLLAGLTWGLLGLVIARAHAVNRWDEGAYLLSGLALRGYGTPYAAHRPPVTHVLAALLADVSWFINPMLLLGLVMLLSAWGAQRWGWSAAPIPWLLLIGQNIFLQSTMDVMSELPAAVLLLSAFFLLAAERFFSAGAIFAFAVLARWNLVVFLGCLIPLVALRAGAKPVLRYTLGGILIIAAWLGFSHMLLSNPLEEIYRSNLVPAYRSAELGQERPDFLSRSHFYITHFYFLTPLGFFAMVTRPFLPAAGRSRSKDWVVRSGIPVSVLVYALAMMSFGGHYPRFMVPVIPLAMLILTDAVIAGSFAFGAGQRSRRLGLLIAGCLAISWGFWPGSVVGTLRANWEHQGIFSERFRREVPIFVDKSVPIYAPAIAPIASVNGHTAMWELRRKLIFPNAKREATSAIRPEADVPRAVAELLRAVDAGSIALVPRSVAVTIDDAVLLTADGGWSLYRVSNRPISKPETQLELLELS